ncbi:hypothetical protein TanjilG_15728 [Lupinus angustifolius]|uniref:HTH myb-type domain-containing protein n=1 Tax=Lupinus angustifolius TaxID=3871 RepID=A0A1J7HNH5_LUPAN|nr:hypothetical protein TanjilG_15728 [Lupinus angustifolius]
MFVEKMMHENKKMKKNGRLVWSIELHNKFLDAVNQLGIEKALPKKILELMNDENLTYQHVASHLQKYKLHLKRASSSVLHQQKCSLNNPLAQNMHELSSFTSIQQPGQSNNTNNEDIHTQMRVFSTSIPSNEQFESWKDHSLDAIYHSNLIGAFDPKGSTLTNSTFKNSSANLVSASSNCNLCSQLVIEIAELKREMAATRDENCKLREIIQDMMARQDMLIHAVLQVVPPSSISSIWPKYSPMSYSSKWVTNFSNVQ